MKSSILGSRTSPASPSKVCETFKFRLRDLFEFGRHYFLQGVFIFTQSKVRRAYPAHHLNDINANWVPRKAVHTGTVEIQQASTTYLRRTRP